jgi:hypothetical protein
MPIEEHPCGQRTDRTSCRYQRGLETGSERFDRLSLQHERRSRAVKYRQPSVKFCKGIRTRSIEHYDHSDLRRTWNAYSSSMTMWNCARS